MDTHGFGRVVITITINMNAGFNPCTYLRIPEAVILVFCRDEALKLEIQNAIACMELTTGAVLYWFLPLILLIAEFCFEVSQPSYYPAHFHQTSRLCGLVENSTCHRHAKTKIPQSKSHPQCHQ